MKLREYPDRDMMMIDLADQLAGELNAALMTHEKVSFAVPGGTTPGPVFDTLSAVDLDWSRVHVLLTDERWVPETSERSNTRLVRQRLLTDKAAKAQFLGFYREGQEPETALDAVGAELSALLPPGMLSRLSSKNLPKISPTVPDPGALASSAMSGRLLCWLPWRVR